MLGHRWNNSGDILLWIQTCGLLCQGRYLKIIDGIIWTLLVCQGSNKYPKGVVARNAFELEFSEPHIYFCLKV